MQQNITLEYEIMIILVGVVLKKMFFFGFKESGLKICPLHECSCPIVVLKGEGLISWTFVVTAVSFFFDHFWKYWSKIRVFLKGSILRSSMRNVTIEGALESWDHGLSSYKIKIRKEFSSFRVKISFENVKFSYYRNW